MQARAQTVLETVEVETGPQPVASVIWLHGLGASGEDFVPAVPALAPPGGRPLRFIFPHAPVRPVTLNGGLPMRAWYDLAGLDRHAPEDESGARRSAAAVHALIEREHQRGMASRHIVLAGFSQGGALALYTALRFPERLAGVIGLSCYLLLATRFSAERHVANQSTPVFLAHGAQDPVIDLQLGEASHALLATAGYATEWHTYAMGHEVCAEELDAIAAFLRKVA